MFELNFRAVTKTRENWKKVIELLRNSKIIPQKFEQDMKLVRISIDQVEYPSMVQKTSRNVDSVYKFVKVCHTCFDVYSFLSSFIENEIQTKEKSKSKTT